MALRILDPRHCFPQVRLSQKEYKLEGDFSWLIGLSVLCHSLHWGRECPNVYISIAFHIIPLNIVIIDTYLYSFFFLKDDLHLLSVNFESLVLLKNFDPLNFDTMCFLPKLNLQVRVKLEFISHYYWVY